MQLAIMAVLLVLVACTTSEPPKNATAADAGDITGAPDAADVDAALLEVDASLPPASGSLRVLTYNVAGLPVGLSDSDPATNTPIMSPLLNQYDLVLAQEDFSFHDALAADALHPYLSTPMVPVGFVPIGDGLNRFSSTAFEELQRVKWIDCNGFLEENNDCFAPKGFSFARHTLAPGVTLDVYNLHADAGRAVDDIDARYSQVTQLVDFINTQSSEQAVLVVGDTNMKEGDEATLALLLSSPGLTDSCVATSCPNPEIFDRFMFRSSDALTLSVEGWWVDATFVDPQGQPLSDHLAIGIDLQWLAN